MTAKEVGAVFRVFCESSDGCPQCVADLSAGVLAEWPEHKDLIAKMRTTYIEAWYEETQDDRAS